MALPLAAAEDGGKFPRASPSEGAAIRAGYNRGGGGPSTISGALTFRVKQEIFACVLVEKAVSSKRSAFNCFPTLN